MLCICFPQRAQRKNPTENTEIFSFKHNSFLSVSSVGNSPACRMCVCFPQRTQRKNPQRTQRFFHLNTILSSLCPLWFFPLCVLCGKFTPACRMCVCFPQRTQRFFCSNTIRSSLCPLWFFPLCVLCGKLP